ncbi:glycerophosphoryl diester phosphodiesterase membrane domain-containing protein [bacterium]|nr:glycerophosphoryl diester phosphodiesterase membrane domain-containing protein [bacterium]
MTKVRTEESRILPLGSMEILTVAITLYKSHFLLLAGISAVVSVPYFILYYALTDVGCNSTIAYMSTFIRNPILSAALVFAVYETCLSREVSVIKSYQHILHSSLVLPLMGAYSIPFALCMLLMWVVSLDISKLVFCMPAMLIYFPFMIYVGIRLLLIVPICVLERTGARATLTRSWNLMKGSMGKAFWLYAAILFMFGGAYCILLQFGHMLSSTGDNMLTNTTLGHVITSIIGLLIAPVFTLTNVFLYYDIRARQEGFDKKALLTKLDNNFGGVGQ